MDVVLPVQRIPNRGESIVSEEKYRYIPGGKGANAAVAAARLGADVIFCARIGADDTGERLLKFYEREDINTKYIKKDRNTPTGLAAILLEDDGSNRIVVYPNANLNLKVDDVEDAFLTYPDAVLLQFETNPEAIIAATEFAARKNIPVIIDAGPVRKDFPYELLKQVEIISPNEVETAQITGMNPLTDSMCLQACMRLQNMTKAKISVLKLSDRGSCSYDGKTFEYYTPHYVNVVDTTAAGDSFTAALAIEYIKNNDIRAACKYANVVGALAVTKFGAVTSLPTKKEVDDFIIHKNIKI
jgi:ribokinase